MLTKYLKSLRYGLVGNMTIYGCMLGFFIYSSNSKFESLYFGRNEKIYDKNR